MSDRDRISYTVQQAAEVLGCSVDTIRRARRAGHLTPLNVKGSKLIVFAAEEVRALLIPAPEDDA